MIDKNLIVKGGSFQNYEEAIKFGGRLLYENGYVDSGYTDSVLEREAQFPTGLPTQGVPMAIPHTGSEDAGSICRILKEFEQFNLD